MRLTSVLEPRAANHKEFTQQTYRLNLQASAHTPITTTRIGRLGPLIGKIILPT